VAELKAWNTVIDIVDQYDQYTVIEDEDRSLVV